MRTRSLLTCLGAGAIAVVLTPVAARSAGQSSHSTYHDNCSAHVLPVLAFTSGPGLNTVVLHGSGTFRLTLSSRGFSYPGRPNTPNDKLAEFFFQPAGSKHHYAGPLHNFQHGSTQHLCLNEKLYIDFDESANATKHGMTKVKADGTIAPGKIRLTMTVAGKTYHLSGK